MPSRDGASHDGASHDGAGTALRDDTEARRVIREELDTSLLVEAAAGTGKTTELVRRLVAILESGRSGPGNVVAVTFTRKAAGELKLRLRQALDRRLSELEGSGEPGEPRANLVEAIARLEEAQIGTIHSFCAEVLRERPVEAGIDPGFEGLSEDEAPRLFHRAFQSWIQEELQAMPEGLRRALSRLATSGGFASPLERLEDAARRLSDWRDFPASWRRPEYDREDVLDRVVAELHDLAAMVDRCESARDILRRDLDPIVELSSWVRRAERIGDRDYDSLEARLLARPSPLSPFKRKGRGFFAEGVERGDVVARREQFRELLDDLGKVADADLAALLHGELQGVIERYEELKQDAGKLDYSDLLVRTRDLLAGDETVRGFLQQRFRHIFVDELQDTDPLQMEILLLLATEDSSVADWRASRPVPGKLFLVGDPKQSIYRFRRADVAMYQAVQADLLERGVELVHLRRSFRSTEAIQSLVNHAFAPEMTADLESGQAGYIGLEKTRETPTGQPSIVALPVGRPYNEYGYITNRQINAELPSATAEMVRWLLEDSGWTVEADRATGERRPVRAEDVCILFRRYISWRRDVTRDYTHALEVRGVSHVLAGERSFHQREEVETLRAALTAIEWPEDELALFATLRGSLFAVNDDTLLRWRLGDPGRLHPFRVPDDPAVRDDPDLRPVAEALELLAKLHRRRNRRPIVATLQELLEFTRAHAAFALRPAGNQVLANVQRVCDLARSYEREGESFRGFVDRLNAEAENPTGAQSPMVEEGAAGVRLMTVHGAKGLEFPVVVLADMTARLYRDTPDRTVDPDRGLCAQSLLGWSPLELLQQADREVERDRSEGVRVAYVAATRARDLLVVPAVGTEPRSGWLEPLSKAIYPDRERYRRPGGARGCPLFGDATVLRMPQEFDREGEASVRPGLHSPEGAAHDVVWWDPRLLDTEVDENFGIRQEDILTPDPGDREVVLGRRRYEEWQKKRRDLLADGARKTIDVVIVTGHGFDEDPPGDPEAIELVEISPSVGGRPSGRRFGTLVHTLLAELWVDTARPQVEALARFYARQLGCPDAEVAAAVEAVTSALGHELLASADVAARDGHCHRELPFSLPLDDGRVLDGVIDLAFRVDGEWRVVDFKTDAALGERLAVYRRQVGWYVYALERLVSEPVRGLLVGV